MTHENRFEQNGVWWGKASHDAARLRERVEPEGSIVSAQANMPWTAAVNDDGRRPQQPRPGADQPARPRRSQGLWDSSLFGCPRTVLMRA